MSKQIDELMREAREEAFTPEHRAMVKEAVRISNERKERREGKD